MINHNVHDQLFRVQNTDATYCPVLKYSIKNADGTLPFVSSYLLWENNTYTESKVRAWTSDPYTETARIYAYTTSYESQAEYVDSTALEAYFNLTIRVCGEEVLTLADPTEMLLIYGITSSYHYIYQSEFASYFTLPSGDPCTVDNYQIKKPDGTDWTDSQIRLIGSMGSYYLRFYKGTAANAKVVHLRAITRGDVYLDKPIKLSICPKTGGFSVTYPPEYQPKTVYTTNGGTYTLPSGALYAPVDQYNRYASSNADIIDWPAWAIQDVYYKCGKFLRYG